MSNIPISSLPVANPLTGEETVPIVQAGTTKRTTSGAISNLPNGTGSGIAFVTVGSATGALPNSRQLSAASPVLLTDGGAGAAVTVGFITGTASYVLTANGAGVAPTFQAAPATGVTSVGLSGGTTGITVSNSPITSNGTMTLGGVLNVSAGGIGTSTLATASVLLGNGTNPISNVTNATSGYVLTSTGPTSAPTFQVAASSGGTGTVTSVALVASALGLTVAGSPVTTNGTLTLSGFLNGTAIATGSITSTQLATNSVTSTQLLANTVSFGKIQQTAGLSVIGVAGTTAGNVGAITATAGQTLRSSAGGTTLVWGAPIIPYSVRNLQGENATGSGSSKYSFLADSVTLVGTSTAFYFTNVGTTTCDILVSGPAVNGRDQSAVITANQFVHFYWITDGATLGLTVSTTPPPVGPVLPAGYSAWAYAAPIRYASGTSLASTHVSGNSVFFKTGQGLLTNGGATSFAALSAANFVPPNSTEFTINASYAGLLTSGASGSAQGTVHWSMDGVNDYSTSVYQIAGFGGAATLVPLTDITFPNRNQTMYYFTQVIVGSNPAVTLVITRYRVPNGS